MATHPRDKHKSIDRDTRRQRVSNLLLAGITNQKQIAAELGVNQGTISRDIKEIQKDWREAAAEALGEARGKDLRRLERLIAAHWDSAKRGHLGATDRVISLINQRMKILGTEAPAKAELVMDVPRIQIVGVSDDDLAGVIYPKDDE